MVNDLPVKVVYSLFGKIKSLCSIVNSRWDNIRTLILVSELTVLYIEV